MGSKLWIEEVYGEIVVTRGRNALGGKIHNPSLERGAGSSMKPQRSDEKDVDMGDVDVVAFTATFKETSLDDSTKTKVVALSGMIDEEVEDAGGNQASIVNIIDAAGTFLEGFLAHANLSKDFIKRGSLDVFLDFIPFPACLTISLLARLIR